MDDLRDRCRKETHFVDGRSAVVHELVELSHKVVLLLARLVIGRFGVRAGLALVVDAAGVVQAEKSLAVPVRRQLVPIQVQNRLLDR